MKNLKIYQFSAPFFTFIGLSIIILSGYLAFPSIVLFGSLIVFATGCYSWGRLDSYEIETEIKIESIN